ncbi:C1 family peptidase [Deinococcus altitudinis]|uniref:C1 family peptidase n=1 Tax=Deinococcus altitudinis TaxID=468914 RepID=UPI003891B56C
MNNRHGRFSGPAALALALAGMLNLGGQVSGQQVAQLQGGLLAQAGGTRLNTTQMNVQLQSLNLTQLLQVAPAFGGASLPAGLRVLQGDEASRFAALGTPTWITAASLQQNSALRVQRLNSNLQVVGRAAAQRPELQNLLEAARTRPFEEPLLTVDTKSGPQQFRLMSAEVGLEQAAGDLSTAVQRRSVNTGLALNYARALNLDAAGIRAVQSVNEVAGAAGATPSNAAVGTRVVVTQALNAVTRLDLRPINIGILQAPQGQGDGLDTAGGCPGSNTGIFSALDFPMKKNLPEVKSQGNRGTCWAFATVGAIETTISRDFGRRVNLSEEDFVSYTKIRAGQLEGGDGYFPFGSAQEAQQSNYRFAFENVWQYNKSGQQTETETPKNSGKWIYAKSCEGYPFATTLCSNTVHQAPSACLLVDGKQSCGFQLAQKRSPYGVDVSRASNLYDADNRDASLFWTALALRSGNPVLMTHDANYLKGGSFVADVPYSSVSHCDDNNQNCKPNTAKDVQSWNHAVLLVGYVTNAEVKAKLPNAPEGAGGGYFIAKNSWSSCWGDGGYAYLPWNWLEKYVGRLDVNINGTVN